MMILLKKLFSFLTICGMVLCLTSCGKSTETSGSVNITDLYASTGADGTGCVVVLDGAVSAQEEVPYDFYTGVLSPEVAEITSGESWQVSSFTRLLSETPVRVSQLYVGEGTIGAISTTVNATMDSSADMDEDADEELLAAVAGALNLSLEGTSAMLDGTCLVKEKDTNALAFYPALYQVNLYSEEDDTEVVLYFPVVNRSDCLDGVYVTAWFDPDAEDK